MKKILFSIVMVMLCGCVSNPTTENPTTEKHPQTRDYDVVMCKVVTTEGDTLELYGGKLDYSVTQRNWGMYNMSMKVHE